jgi:hypothetical protein
MKDPISGKQILEQRNVSVHTLLSYMMKGLKAKTQYGEIVYNSDDFSSGPTIDERRRAITRYAINKMRKERSQPAVDDMSSCPDG